MSRKRHSKGENTLIHQNKSIVRIIQNKKIKTKQMRKDQFL